MGGAKKEFTFRITYFKKTGKYYSDTDYRYDAHTLLADSTTPSMTDVVDRVRGLRDGGGVMPGLGGESGWDGFIMVQWLEVHDGMGVELHFPTLILPG